MRRRTNIRRMFESNESRNEFLFVKTRGVYLRFYTRKKICVPCSDAQIFLLDMSGHRPTYPSSIESVVSIERLLKTASVGRVFL